MEREVVIVATLVVYKVVLVGLGLFAQRRTQNGADFFLGGRGLGPIVASVSASASSSSVWTLLGVSGAAYAWGLGAVWLFPACVGGFALNWYLLAPALRRLSHRSLALTTTEVLAGEEGSPWRGAIVTTASLITIVSLGVYVASQFQGAGKAFNETFGLSVESSILVGSAIVVVYTLLGGFWAVSMTDTLQGLLMVLTSIVLPFAALRAVGGPSELFVGMAAVDVEGYTSLTRSLSGPLGIGFVAGLLGIGLGYPGQPHVVNRFMALKEEPGALRLARRLAMGWAVVVYAGMLLLGWCGRLLLPGLGDKEVVFVAATHLLFSPVVGGVMLAAVLSAIMSTADSQLLVVASTVTHDLGLGGHGKQDLLWRSRLAVVGVSGLAVVIAFVGSQEIFSRVLFAWSAMGAAFGPLLLVVALRGPVSPPRTLAAMVAGFGLSVAAYSFALTKGGVTERVLPFVVALLIAGFSRRRRSGPKSPTIP